MKIWQFLCIAFCVYCLTILVEDHSEFTFLPANSENELYNFSICLDLAFVLHLPRVGCQAIDLDELHRNLSLRSRQISARFISNPRQMKKYNRLVLNRIESGDYYLFNDQFCLIQANLEDLNAVDAYYNQRTSGPFVFKRSRYTILKLQNWYKPFNQFVLVDKEANPESNCKEGFIKFECLNQCFKAKRRLSRYFYDGRERGALVFINYEHNDTIRKAEHECMTECPGNDCKLTVVEQKARSEGETATYVYEAKRLVSNFDFIAQFLGPICLHLGICVSQVLGKLKSFVDAKIVKAAKYSLVLKIAILSALATRCTATPR